MDHKLLTFLFELHNLHNAKIQRWALLLSEYNADIQYCTGKSNLRADAPSRLPAYPTNIMITPWEREQLEDLALNVLMVAAPANKAANTATTADKGEMDMDAIDHDSSPMQVNDHNKEV